MKHIITIACGLALAPLIAYGADATELKTQKEKNSYSIGMSLGRGWKASEVDIDMDALNRGIKDMMTGTPLLTQEQAQENIRLLQTEIRSKMDAKRKAQGETNKVEGAAFLEKNKTQPGVVTTASGLQYKVLTEGKGASPKPDENVVVNYKGTLIDGTEFDSSYKRNQPFTTGLNRVVKGWQEALPLMKVGSKWQIFVPSALAYGERGSGNIAPNAVLIFEIELVDIKPAQVAQPQNPPQPVTSDIIKVPSAEEMKKGAQIEVIKKEDVDKVKAQTEKK